jgi:hypothetical protein
VTYVLVLLLAGKFAGIWTNVQTRAPVLFKDLASCQEKIKTITDDQKPSGLVPTCVTLEELKALVEKGK